MSLLKNNSNLGSFFSRDVLRWGLNLVLTVSILLNPIAFLMPSDSFALPEDPSSSSTTPSAGDAENVDKWVENGLERAPEAYAGQLSIAEALDEGGTAEAFEKHLGPAKKISHIFNIVGQNITYIEEDGSDLVYEITDPRRVVTLPPMRYGKSSLLVKTRIEDGRNLIFSGDFGYDKDGNYGKEVVRQKVPFSSDIISVTPYGQDPDFMMVLLETGELWAFYVPTLQQYLFESIIPVFSIWSPATPEHQEEFKRWVRIQRDFAGNAKIETGFLTLGSNPTLLRKDNLENAMIVPNYLSEKINDLNQNVQSSNKYEVVKAWNRLVQVGGGAYYFTLINGIPAQSQSTDHPASHLLGGIFDREELLKMVAAQMLYFYGLAATVDPQRAEINRKNFERIQEMSESISAQADKLLNIATASPVESVLLSRFDADQLNTLSGLVKGSIGVASSHSGTDMITREAMIHFADQVDKMQVNKQQSQLSDKERETQWKQIVQKNLSQQPIDILNEPGKLGVFGRKNINQGQATRLDQLRTSIKALMPTNPVTRANVGLALAGLLYVGYPYVYPHIEAAAEFTALAWMYEHYFFVILKDEALRGSAIAGLLMGSAVLPAMLILSSTAGALIEGAGKVLAGSRTTPFARSVRNFVNTWGAFEVKEYDTPEFQEALKNKASAQYWINTFKVGIKRSMLRMIAAINRMMIISLSPFIWVPKAARMAAGLPAASVRAAQKARYEAQLKWYQRFADPTQDKNISAIVEVEENLKRLREEAALRKQQAATEEEAKQSENATRLVRIALAAKIAVLVVAQQNQIAPEILMEETPLKEEDWSLYKQEIQSNSAKRKQAQILHNLMMNELESLSFDELMQTLKSPEGSEAFQRVLGEAQSWAITLKKSRIESVKQSILLSWEQFSSGIRSRLYKLAHMGGKNVRMWMTIKPEEVSRESLTLTMNEIGTDMAIGAVMSALFPPVRLQMGGKLSDPIWVFANPQDPAMLFGQTTFPFLGPAGLASEFSNGFSHVGNAATLLATGETHQKFEEAPYQLKEEVLYPIKDREESFGRTLSEAIKAAMDFPVSDIGGFQEKYFANIWGAWPFLLVNALISRYILWDWGLGESIGGFIVEQSAAFIFYRWIWAFLRTAPGLWTKRYAQNKAKMNNLIRTLYSFGVKSNPFQGADRANENAAANGPLSDAEREELKAAIHEVVGLYAQHDPETFKKMAHELRPILESPVASHLTSSEARELYKQVRKGARSSFAHQGLVADLLYHTKLLKDLLEGSAFVAGDASTRAQLEAQIAQQRQKVDETFSLLAKAVRQDEARAEAEQDEILRRNAHGMGELMRSLPPLPTKVGASYQTVATLWIGAIGTTAIGLFTYGLSAHRELMADPTYIAEWFFASYAYIKASAFVASADAWYYFMNKSRFKGTMTKIAQTIFPSERAKKRAAEEAAAAAVAGSGSGPSCRGFVD